MDTKKSALDQMRRRGDARASQDLALWLLRSACVALGIAAAAALWIRSDRFPLGPAPSRNLGVEVTSARVLPAPGLAGDP